mgnify:CR=1 FL=1
MTITVNDETEFGAETEKEGVQMAVKFLEFLPDDKLFSLKSLNEKFGINLPYYQDKVSVSKTVKTFYRIKDPKTNMNLYGNKKTIAKAKEIISNGN